MATQVMDQERLNAFGDEMVAMLNHAGLALMVSLGHRSGLFDTLATLAPSTSLEIASAANLNERYVREWLGAMVTGGVVEYDPEQQTYRLPREHAAFLTRAAGGDNIANTVQFVPMLGAVEDQVLACFRNGGGVPYTEFKRFHEIMADESDGLVVGSLMAHILPLVPGLVERLAAGIDVLDVGCGQGRALMLMAEQFPNSRFVGYDFSEEAITSGQRIAQERGLSNVRLAVADASKIGDQECYDLVTAFDAIHDQTFPQAVLLNVRRALREGGTFLMQDIRASSCVHENIGQPVSTFIYAISCMHCMTVSLAGGGEGLGAAWGKELALEYLARAGFEGVQVHELEHDIQNYYYVMSK